ncbi:MAG: hypothetical protein R2798_03970 [Chitinophagales bacterium]
MGNVTGTQDPMPSVECWETATFNNSTCVWDVTGTQDPNAKCRMLGNSNF